MKKAVIGILAHVDAGKTTLAEALLFRAGKLRTQGRVDKGDTALDTHALERERGITIFASQAVFQTEKLSVTLLDTPGHVDFSGETERTLSVLDYAVLVISGIDGVQSHTLTLWRLLEHYNIPVFVFVTKMDFARRTREDLLSQLNTRLSSGFLDMGEAEPELFEKAALCSEATLESYLASGTIGDEELALLIRSRKLFPCYFGSGLKAQGIDELTEGFDRFIRTPVYPDLFGAKVFKISRDRQGNRLTHMKLTGGTLRVKDFVGEEKADQLRVYSGEKYTTADSASAGEIVAVTGLDSTVNGQGLGFESSGEEPFLEPVMNYRIVLPDGCDAKTMMGKLKLLEEEEPLLRVTWNSFLQEIHVGLMGEVQTEILKSLIYDRFDVKVEIDGGQVMYKETIRSTVEGVGHYEPLRHYAEVHLIMEPLPRGSGLVFASSCSENSLDRNWQRLILSHLQEKEHLGVLTGSPITDMKLTLAAGRAHIKHTEGGDFRQATYRAVRQGLMGAESVLLEPFCAFTLEIPSEQTGRAINDIRMKSGTMEPMQTVGEMTVLKGKAPVITMNGYAAEVAAYTGGRGRLLCENAGYDLCHDSESVKEAMRYSPESDLENTPDSVFCAHGGGFNVKWDKVPEYMHIESCLQKDPMRTAQLNRRNFHIDDKELEQIMLREFGPVKQTLYRRPDKHVTSSCEPEPVVLVEREQYVLVDGYNCIFAWDELKALAEDRLEDARKALMERLCNYSAFTKNHVVLVFDAYKVEGNPGKRFDYNNIHVVYTKERELGDVYIERLVREIGKNDRVRVVSSDRLIQLSAVRFGVLRVSAKEFASELDEVEGKISRVIEEMEGK